MKSVLALLAIAAAAIAQNTVTVTTTPPSSSSYTLFKVLPSSVNPIFTSPSIVASGTDGYITYIGDFGISAVTVPSATFRQAASTLEARGNGLYVVNGATLTISVTESCTFATYQASGSCTLGGVATGNGISTSVNTGYSGQVASTVLAAVAPTSASLTQSTNPAGSPSIPTNGPASTTRSGAAAPAKTAAGLAIAGAAIARIAAEL